MFINTTMAIYIESIRNSRPAILLRYAKRNAKPSSTLSKTPAFIVNAIGILLKGGVIVNSLDQTFTVHRSLPNGHVAALVTLASQIGLPRILHRTSPHHLASLQTRHYQSAFARNRRQLAGHSTQA